MSGVHTMGYSDYQYDCSGIGQLQCKEADDDDRGRREPPAGVEDHLQNL